MYCDGKDWDSRRSGQFAQLHVLRVLVKLVAPVLAHTSEETWSKIPGASPDSIHMQVFDSPTEERLEEIEANALQARFAALLEARGEIAAAFEQWKLTGSAKDSQDVVVRATFPSAKLEVLRTFLDEDLALYFRHSWVELAEGPTHFEFSVSTFPKCDRSRLRRPDVVEVTYEGEQIQLTERDRRALGL
jgi:isoleucyl-tRNA synthetase